MFSTYNWSALIWTLAFTVPIWIVWGFAIWFCFTRRRENPTGAKYLGLAVLVQFVNTAFSQFFPYTWGWFNDGTSAGQETFNQLYRVILGVKICANVVSWILIIMAVFARPTHSDYTGSPTFDDEL